MCTLGVVMMDDNDRRSAYAYASPRASFQAATKLVWTVIVIQAVGGLNVAFILKYADNILKGWRARLRRRRRLRPRDGDHALPADGALAAARARDQRRGPTVATRRGVRRGEHS